VAISVGAAVMWAWLRPFAAAVRGMWWRAKPFVGQDRVGLWCECMDRNHGWFHTSKLCGDTSVVTCSERSVEAVWMYLVYIGTLTSAGSGGTPFEIVVQHYLRKGSVVGCAFLVIKAQEHSPLEGAIFWKRRL